MLSRQCKQPSLAACKLIVYLLRYIQGSTDEGIRFSESSFDLHVFSDSDWAGDRVTRRSTTGYIVFACGGPIVWQSKLQTTVSTSSMQAEYQAMYAGMQELVWIRGVLGEIGRPEVEPTPFFIDSQSAEDLALNPVFHKRSKHIEITYHWIREHVGTEYIQYVTTRLTRGTYSMLQVYLLVTILIETFQISKIYHQPLLNVLLQYILASISVQHSSRVLKWCLCYDGKSPQYTRGRCDYIY